MDRQKNFEKYLESLTDKVFKILPLYEERNSKLHVYINSLIFELDGLDNVVSTISCESEYISLLSTLESLANESIVFSIKNDIVKREVFKSLDIVGKMKEKVGGK